MASVHRRGKGGKWVARWTDWEPTPEGWVRRRRTTAGTHNRAETARLGRRLEDEARARMLAESDPAAALARVEGSAPSPSTSPTTASTGGSGHHRQAPGRHHPGFLGRRRVGRVEHAARQRLRARRPPGRTGRADLADRTLERTRIACRMFARWAIGDEALDADPFARVARRRVVKQTKTRRAASPDELAALYRARRGGQPDRFPQHPRPTGGSPGTGPARTHLAAVHGLQGSGRPGRCHRPPRRVHRGARGCPAIKLPAHASKHRKADHLPLRARRHAPPVRRAGPRRPHRGPQPPGPLELPAEPPAGGRGGPRRRAVGLHRVGNRRRQPRGPGAVGVLPAHRPGPPGGRCPRPPAHLHHRPRHRRRRPADVAATGPAPGCPDHAPALRPHRAGRRPAGHRGPPRRSPGIHRGRDRGRPRGRSHSAHRPRLEWIN